MFTRFRSLRTRLTVLYAGLFAAAMLLISLAVYTAISDNAIRVVRGELAAILALGGGGSWRGSSGTKHSALRWWPPSPTPWRLGACAPARAIAPWCI